MMAAAAEEGRGRTSKRGTVCICVCGGTLQVRGRSAARNVIATQQLAGEVEEGSCRSSAAEMEVVVAGRWSADGVDGRFGLEGDEELGGGGAAAAGR